MSFSNYMFRVDLQKAEDGIHLQLWSKSPRHPRYRAICTYELAAEMERLAGDAGQTWRVSADAIHGRVLVDGLDDVGAAERLVTKAATEAGFPVMPG